MKGIILAAGQGVRLRPLTDDRPKCMVVYQGRPLIDHILETFSQFPIQPIVLVTGYCSQILEEHVREHALRIVHNPDYATTNMVHSLFCAESELNDDVILSYSDIVYRPEVLQRLVECTADLAITIDTEWRSLWQQRMSDPLADAETLQLDPQGRVLDLGRKPKSYDEIQGQYMGLVKISGRVIGQVRQLYHGLDRNAICDGKSFPQMFMTTFIRTMIQAGIPCQSVPVQGGWLEVDAPSDLELTF